VEIPKAHGEARTQVAHESVDVPEATSALPNSFPQALSNLTAYRTRGIGTDAAQLTTAYLSERWQQLQDASATIVNREQAIEGLRVELATAREKLAAQTVELGAQHRLDNIFKGIGILCAALFGVGADLAKGTGDLPMLGWILISVGVVGVLASCWSFRGSTYR